MASERSSAGSSSSSSPLSSLPNSTSSDGSDGSNFIGENFKWRNLQVRVEAAYTHEHTPLLRIIDKLAPSDVALELL